MYIKCATDDVILNHFLISGKITVTDYSHEQGVPLIENRFWRVDDAQWNWLWLWKRHELISDINSYDVKTNNAFGNRVAPTYQKIKIDATRSENFFITTSNVTLDYITA